MGGDKKVPVKILHDTAASDSFIQLLVLPFLKESDTGCLVPLLGMGMKILQVHTSGRWRASNIANWGHYICVGKWLCRRSRLGWSSAACPAAHPKNSQLKVLVGFVFPCDPRSYVVRSNCSLFSQGKLVSGRDQTKSNSKISWLSNIRENWLQPVRGAPPGANPLAEHHSFRVLPEDWEGCLCVTESHWGEGSDCCLCLHTEWQLENLAFLESSAL